MSGPTAQALSRVAYFDIEGTMERSRVSRANYMCDSSNSGPTINTPHDITRSHCYTGAHVTSIKLVNGATKETLKEWRVDPGTGMIG